MAGSRFLAALFAIGVSSLSGQQPFVSAQTAPSASPLSPADSRRLAVDISASYYHPDDLAGLACGTVFDFGSLLKQLGLSDSGEQTKAVSGIRITVDAVRGQNPKIDIAWQNGAPASKDSLETGVRQMLSGFFQVYWPFAGSSMTPGPAEKFHAEVQAGGGHILRSNVSSVSVTTEVDGDNVPTKVFVDSPAFKATLGLRFAPPQNPIPGDLRRLTSLDFSEQIGSTNLNGRLSIDYQTIEGFNIPRHVSFNIGGAYSVSMEFVGCSATKRAHPDAGPK